MAGIGHRGFMGRSASTFCPYLPGLYTESEIDDLVFIDGYIPVYDADEFDKIRTGVLEVMGGCTKWGGNYTTGVDKKYVQVMNIDFSGFGSFSPLSPFAGVYDGNCLRISGYSSVSAPFNSFNVTGTYINIYIDVDINSSSPVGGLCNYLAGLSTITNCHVTGSVHSSSINVGGIASQSGSGSAVKIINSSFSGDISGSYQCGGIIGTTNNSEISGCTVFDSTIQSGAGSVICNVAGITPLSHGVRIKKCKVQNSHIIASVSKNSANVAGLANVYNGGLMEECIIIDSTITVAGGQRVGGFTSTFDSSSSIVRECEAINVIINAPLSSSVGGFAGNRLTNGNLIENCRFLGGEIIGDSNVSGGVGGSTVGLTVINSYSNAIITASGSSGGLATDGSGTFTDCYWDTDVSGIATSAAGTGKTTVELQAPTSNTGIYANYDPLIWDFGTSSEYPKLINTP